MSRSPKTQSPLLQVRIPPEVLAKLKAKAAADARTVTAYVRALILRDLGMAK